jgi:glycosyltransferase involved in cell wall biosynthesis
MTNGMRGIGRLEWATVDSTRFARVSTSRAPLSAVVITRNAATQIEPCLASLAFADEIIVVDSGSEDATREIAAAKGARIIEHEWLGYGPQKQFAVDAAAHDWVLCIDADERVSERLRSSIRGALAAPAAPVYRMARRNRFLGRWLAHGEGYPDWSPRLFDRRAARWSDDPVHEKVLFTATPGTLAGDLLHESAETLASYLEKQNRYTTLAAEQLYANGRRASILELVVSPTARFIKFYLLRLGFLDGIPGLVHIAIGCMNSYTKYAKLIELQRSRPPAPV